MPTYFIIGPEVTRNEFRTHTTEDVLLEAVEQDEPVYSAYETAVTQAKNLRSHKNKYYSILEIDVSAENVAKFTAAKKPELDKEIAFTLPAEAAFTILRSHLPKTARSPQETIEIHKTAEKISPHKAEESDEENSQEASAEHPETSGESLADSREKNPAPDVAASSSPSSVNPPKADVQPANAPIKASKKPKAAPQVVKENEGRLWKIFSLGTAGLGVSLAFLNSTHVSGLLSIAADSIGLTATTGALGLATKGALYAAAGTGALAVSLATCWVLDKAVTAFQTWRVKKKGENYKAGVASTTTELDKDEGLLAAVPSLQARSKDLIGELKAIAATRPEGKFEGTAIKIPANDRLAVLAWEDKKVKKLLEKSKAPRPADVTDEAKALELNTYADKVLSKARAKLH